MATFDDDDWEEGTENIPPSIGEQRSHEKPICDDDDDWVDNPKQGYSAEFSSRTASARYEEFSSKENYRGKGGSATYTRGKGFGDRDSGRGGRGGGRFSHTDDQNGKDNFRSGDKYSQNGEESGGFRRGGFSRQSNDDSGFYQRGSGSRGGRGNYNRRNENNDDDLGGAGGFRGSRGCYNRRTEDNDDDARAGGFRGGRGGFNRRNEDNDDDSRGGPGGFRGGRSSFNRTSDNGYSGGFQNQDEEESFGGRVKSFRGASNGESNDEEGNSTFRGGRGRGGRGRGRGNGRFYDNDDDNQNFGSRGGFGNDDVESDGFRGGRGRGGGRGGNRGGRAGADDNEKPKERYIPEDIDDSELFSLGISSGINFDKYDKIDIKVTGSDVPNKITCFETSNLRSILLTNVKNSGYKKPTPVQKAAIPIVMNGRDVMACAQTGSGKTAAFLLPILHTLLTDSEPAEVTPEGTALPFCIILSPTRELAIQIYNEARKFSKNTIIKCELIYGGTSTYMQIQRVMKGIHVLVATPGRMDDMLEKNRLSYSNVRFVVLDEADRMLDMGFLPAIEKMFNHKDIKPAGERVTLMFSATFPTEVQQLAGKFLSNYIFISVGIVGGACSDVEQSVMQVPRFEKRKELTQLLDENKTSKTIVFVETKRTADFIATFLSDNGYPTTSIHGDRLQRQREDALLDFRAGRQRILVATAVAARGLDIKEVEFVINFDLPKSIDEYVHRIGRTGRVGNCGKAVSFYDSEENRALAADLLRILVQAQQDVPDWLQQDASEGTLSSFSHSAFGGSDIRKFGRRNKENDTEHFSAPAPVEPEESWD